MKTSTTLVLVIVCAVLVAAVYFFSRQENQHKTGPVIGAAIFPAFPVNDITKIVIRDAAQSVTLTKASGKWGVPEQFDFPATYDRIDDLLKKAFHLKIGQTVRVKPTSLKTLELVDPSDAKAPIEGKGALFEFYTAAARPFATLIVGKAISSEPAQEQQMPFMRRGPADGRYVRIPGSDAVLMIGEDLGAFGSSADAWLEKQLFSVPNDQLSEITITAPTRQSYTLRRPLKGADLVLFPIEATNQVKTIEANSVASGLSYFRIDRVVPPRVAATNAVLKKAYTYVAKLYNGTVYTLTISDTNLPESYLQVAVAYEKPPVDPANTNKAAIAAEEKSQYQVQEDAKQLNEKLSRWLFVLDNYKAGELRKARKDLVEPKSAPSKEPTAADAMPGARPPVMATPPPADAPDHLLTAVTNAVQQAAGLTATNAPPSAPAAPQTK